MRQMPMFGRGTIRRFRTNVSRQNKLAARDYEAFLQVHIYVYLRSLLPYLHVRLQVMIPAIEGLLPQRHNDIVIDMLFELANWHALAKLRLHTTVTLDVFKECTKRMYASVRRFARTTCAEYITCELDREAEARGRRQARVRSKALLSGRTNIPAPTTGPKVVEFRVWLTYKYHCLGDYPEYIERSGPTDCTTSQTVSPSPLSFFCSLTHPAA